MQRQKEIDAYKEEDDSDDEFMKSFIRIEAVKKTKHLVWKIPTMKYASLFRDGVEV